MERGPLRREFWSGDEFVRWLPMLGLAVMVVELAAWQALRERDPETARAVLAGVGALFLSGKEGGLPTALAAGASPLEAGLFLFGADVAFTCFVYPPIHVAMFRWMRGRGLVATWLREMHAKAKRHEGFIVRFGAAGLFLFMLIPFIFNGPVVGAILGRLVAMPARVIVPTLLLAIALTFAAWTAIYGYGLAYAALFHPNLPKIVAGTAVGTLAAWGFVRFVRQRMQERREERKGRGESGEEAPRAQP